MDGVGAGARSARRAGGARLALAVIGTLGTAGLVTGVRPSRVVRT